MFNLFTGYNPQILTPYDKSKQKQILQPFHDLGLQLCEGNEKYYKYLLSYFAQMIKHPDIRVPVSPCLTGPQGAGKNLFMKPLSYIVGRSHFMSSSKLEDFFGTHAEGFYHKLLVNPNELEGCRSNEYEAEMKSAITEDTITINAKNVRPIEINNFARVVPTSNKTDLFKIDFNSKERRYFLFLATKHYLQPKYNSAFWQKLDNHFKNPQFIACLYDELNEMDISNVDWRKDRPITETYLALMKQSVPKEVLFMTSFLNGYDKTEMKVEQTIKGKQFYDAFVAYAEDNGFYSDRKFKASIKTFYADVRRTSKSIKEVTLQNQTHLRFKPSQIMEEYYENDWIERNEGHTIKKVIDAKEEVLGDEFEEMFVI